MTSINNNNRPQINRTNSAPVKAPAPKPELKRADSAPAKLESKVKNEVKTAGAHLKDKVEGAKTPSTSSASAASQASTKGGIFNKLKDSAKNWAKGAQENAQSKAMGGHGVISKGLNGLGVASGLNNVAQGTKGIVDGIKNHDANQAIGGAIQAGRGALSTVKSGLNLAAGIESAKGLKGVTQAAENALKDGSKIGKTISGAAAEAAHLGKDVKQTVLGAAAASKGLGSKIGVAIKQGAADILKDAGIGKGIAGKLEGSIAKAGEKVLGGAAKAGEVLKGAEAAAKAGSEVAKGAGFFGKAAGRFVPGLDIGIAALDAANAAKTIADPKASIADKVTSGITALGSAAAATNIPIVSQVGAAVSLGSSLVGAAIDHAGDIKKVAEKVGDGIKEGAKKVGEFFSHW